MDGQNKRADSSARARRVGRKAVRLPDRVAVACPPNTKRRIEEAAAHDDMSPADWMRRLIRRGLDAARKRMARAGGGS